MVVMMMMIVWTFFSYHNIVNICYNNNKNINNNVQSRMANINFGLSPASFHIALIAKDPK